ncbi:MAG: succinylglutamate desuccinylase [Paraglaciecola chathamensis]
MYTSQTNQLIDQLASEGQFLLLSRRSPELFTAEKDPVEFTLSNGTLVHIVAPGIIAFTPAEKGNKAIILSSGIHGNETAPIEICDQYVVDILTCKITLGHRVLFIFGNLPAMDKATRFVDENLNRLFSQAHSSASVNQNAYECARAKELEEAVAQFYNAPLSNKVQPANATPQDDETRYHYDLHTAIRPSKNEKFAVYPYLHGESHSKEQLSFLLACGVDTFLLSGSSTTTFSYFSSRQFNAHAFTVELGKVQPFGQNDMSRFTAVNTTLRQFICGEPLISKPYNNDDMLIYRVNQVINKHSDDFVLDFSDDLPNFSTFEKGALLAHETGAEYRAQYDGEAVVFPNANVALGQRAILTVVPTTLD